jgi:sulfatase maturation enzyme AslB (radical SAM superfamily)
MILINLSDLKKIKRRDFSIILRSNLTQENFQKIDEYLKLLEKFCEEDNRFSIAIFKAGNWLDKAQNEILGQLIENENNLKKIYKVILDSNRKINLSTLFLILEAVLAMQAN